MGASLHAQHGPISPPKSQVPVPQTESQQSAAVTPTITVNVQRVSVDVVVTDASGRPVKGLTRDDFKVSEDGKPQALRSFDAYTAHPEPPITMPKLPPNTFSNFSMATTSGPATVLLYDLLNTPRDAQPYARQQLLEFVKKRSRSSPVAIFVLTDRLHMVQGFTDDDNALAASLKRQGGYQSGQLQNGVDTVAASNLADGNIGTGTTPTPGGGAAQTSTNDPYQAVSDALQHIEVIESSALLDQRVRLTAEALEEIAKFLAGLPGRKNVLWMSGSFPQGVLPNPNLTGHDVFDVTRSYSDIIREATNALNDSHAAVYPIDVRGLQVDPMYSPGSAKTYAVGSGNQVKALQDFAQSQASEHSTMDSIGEETGGRAFYNTNGLAAAAVTAVEDGSSYYTLVYAPTNTKADGAVRSVKVQCLKPGYTLAYRHNYFAAGGTKEPAKQVADVDALDPLELPLRHGAPPAHELFFEAHLQPEGSPVAATPQEQQMLDEYKPSGVKKKAVVASAEPMVVQHYLLTYGLLLRQLQLPLGQDGKRRGDLEFAVMAYDEDGLLLTGVRTKVQDVILPERYAEMQSEGYHWLQRIDVPVKAATLRIGVRDGLTKRIGSTELHLPLETASAR